MIPFGPWHPDNKTTNAGLSKTAEGVIRQPGGWGPYPQLVTADGAEALSGDPRGVKSVQKPDDSWAVYGATATTIEELQADGTWDDVETGRSTPDGEDVSMVLFGKYLVNTDTVSGMKAYDTLSGGANSAVTGAPAARAVCIIGNALFGLGTSTETRRFASTAIGSHSQWTGGAADGGTFTDGGSLVGGIELRDRQGVLFQTGALRRVQFGVGASTYAIDKLGDGVGCVAERTICGWDGRAAWWHDDGPWAIVAGGPPQPIGNDKINNWARDNIGRQNFKSLQGSVDPTRKLFMWRIDESRILAFNWLSGEFSIIPATTAALARIATPALSVDDLTGTVDALEGSVDSLGGSTAPEIGGLNLSRKFATFTGTNMAVTLEGQPVESGVTGLITRATPIDDANAGTLQIGVSDRLDTALTWKSGEAKGASGTVPLRARGKVMAYRRNIPAGTDFTYVNGVDHVQGSTGGWR